MGPYGARSTDHMNVSKPVSHPQGHVLCLLPVGYIYDSQSPTGPGIKLLNSVFVNVRLDLRVVPGPSGLAEP